MIGDLDGQITTIINAEMLRLRSLLEMVTRAHIPST